MAHNGLLIASSKQSKNQSRWQWEESEAGRECDCECVCVNVCVERKVARDGRQPADVEISDQTNPVQSSPVTAQAQVEIHPRQKGTSREKKQGRARQADGMVDG